jgi:hypothetical protein
VRVGDQLYYRGMTFIVHTVAYMLNDNKHKATVGAVTVDQAAYIGRANNVWMSPEKAEDARRDYLGLVK